MTWTYSGAPVPGSVDEVRLLIGDTDSTQPQLQNEEIQYFIDKYGAGYPAAAAAARALQGIYSRRADSQVGEVSQSSSQIALAYKALAADLSNKAALYVEISAGGVNVADNERADADDTQIQPAFKRGQFDNPEAGGV